MMQARSQRARTWLVACALGTIAVAPVAFAEPRVHTDHGVSYVTGGVGEEEQQTLASLLPQGHNLKLVFAEARTGAYVADVHVTVTDARGRTVFDAVAEGPTLLARLPEGAYDVTAEFKGARQTRTVDVRRSADVTFHWGAEAGSAPEPAAVRVPHEEVAPLPAGAPADGGGMRR